jgi:NAD(P)-dependent dehydrogenase (short-subunit alcohol dehydrogenase family)
MHVFPVGRTAERLEETAKLAREAGGAATPVVADTTQERDVLALFERVDREGPPLEVVAYNAGNNRFQPFLEMETEFFETMWRVGCLGGFLVGREGARRLVARGRGSLLFTGATASLRGRPPFAAFASAKAGLRALAQSLAREFGPKGVHVAHVIVDGGIDGDQVNLRFPQLREAKGEAGMLDPDAIAETFFQLHVQHPSAWTHELDLRPFKESF